MRIDGLYLRLVRVEHELGADLLVELLRREEAERDGSLLERGALLVRLLCALGDIYLGVSMGKTKVRGTYYRSQGAS